VESKIEPWATPIFFSFKNVLVEQLSTSIVDLLLQCLFKGRGSPSKLLKKDSPLSSVTPRYNDAGSSDSPYLTIEGVTT
jgi:hypothetical protein